MFDMPSVMREDIETGRIRSINPQTLELSTFKLDEAGNLWRIDCMPIKMVRRATSPFDELAELEGGVTAEARGIK